MPRRTNQSSQAKPSVISQVMNDVVEPHRSWMSEQANPPTPCPPNALPTAYNEAHALTQQLHKMASLNRLPLLNSQGLERLLFRLVRVNEAMVVIFNEILERGLVATASPRPVRKHRADEAYQPSYCDDCGWELTPTGDCVNPLCSELGG